MIRTSPIADAFLCDVGGFATAGTRRKAARIDAGRRRVTPRTGAWPAAQKEQSVSTQPTAIAFFETEPWERAYFEQHFAGRSALFSDGPLDAATAAVSGAQVASVFIHSPVGAAELDALPSLRCIVTRSTGYDHIDLDECNRRGIVVCNVPSYGENTVAEHTFGLMLALSRKVLEGAERARAGNASLEGLMGFDLRGRTLGVIGAGAIGLHVIRIGRAFGMEVLAYDVRPLPLLAEVLGFRYAPLDEVIADADVVSLHVPSVPATLHLMNRARFALMKPGSLLINTARGAVVDTEALMWALDQGILAGAGLDVIEGEELLGEERQLLDMPAAEDKLRAVLRQHDLLRRPNVVITPHTALYSLQRIADITVANIEAFLNGQPQNVVNRPESPAA
ncbi:MAG: hydroxyacid dehydrogenase [Chloroflexi bacterium]|nr:hydroxyacid dehydrogenase [Chloroflexota bacterium]